MSSPDGEITRLLRQWQEGDGASLDALLPEVWQELRRIAAHELRANAGHETLQPTALVNDLFVRLLARAPSNARSVAVGIGVVPISWKRWHFPSIRPRICRHWTRLLTRWPSWIREWPRLSSCAIS